METTLLMIELAARADDKLGRVPEWVSADSARRLPTAGRGDIAATGWS